MKTEYEKLYKYDLNNLVFGVPKKRYRIFYFALAIIFVVLGLVFEI